MPALIEKNESRLQNVSHKNDIKDFIYLVENIKSYQVDIQKIHEKIVELTEEKSVNFSWLWRRVPSFSEKEKEAMQIKV